MSEHCFDKFLEEKFASIEDKFSAIKEENNRMREEIKAHVKSFRDEIKACAERLQKSVDETLAEMRERDKQRHAENLAVNARIEENVKAIVNKIDTTKKWKIGYILGTGLSIIGLIITAIVSITSLVQ